MKLNNKKTALIVLLIIVLIPVLLLTANLQKARRLDRDYTDLKSTAKTGPYLLSELILPGKRLLLQSADRNGADAKQITQSYLRYDTLNQLIIIASEEPAPQKQAQPNPDQLTHLSFFDLKGKKIRQKSRLYRLDNTALENTILLQDSIRPFQHWKDPKQEIYLRHFKISHFDFSSINPFQLGSINGGSPIYPWSGTGYYELKMQNEILKFKLPAEKKQVFFTEKHAYQTGLKLYHINENAPELKILIHQRQDSPPKIYLISKGIP